MALTRVAPAGIGSTPGTGYVIGDSFLHSRGLNATDGYYTGIVTTQSLRVIGDLEVEGTTTTLDTALTEVDKLEVGANNNTVGVAITQSGTGDILNLYDGATEVFSVLDGGAVRIDGNVTLNNSRTITHTSLIIDKPDAGTGTLKFFNNGSASAYIQHTGAEHLHYYLPSGSGYHAFYTNGSNERLRIKSDGDTSLSYNLLIPEDKKIHLEGSSADDYNAIWKADTENTVFVTSRFHIANIIDSNNDDTNAYWSVRKDGTTLAGSDELMRVQSDGKIGIGTDNPTATLEVATSVDGEATLATFKNTSGGGTNETVDIKLGLENNVASNVILRAGKEANHGSGAAADNFFAIHTTLDNTSSEKLRITSGGYVGVNETSPSNRLHVKETNSNTIVGRIESSGAYSYLSLEDNSTTTGHVRVGAHGNDLVLRAGNDNYFRVTSAGNVGIGTDDPDVYSLGGNNRYAAIKASAGYTVLNLVDSNNSGSYLQFGNPTVRRGSLHFDSSSNFLVTINESGSGTNLTEKLRLDLNGRLTISGQGLKLNPTTSSLYTLDGSLSYYATNNAVYLNGAGTNGWLRLNASGAENNQNAINIFGGGAGAHIDMRTNNVERLRIANDGYIGIGTAGNSAPTAPLSIKVGSSGEYLQDFRGSSTKQWGFYYDQGNWLESTFRIDEFDNNGNATSRLTITSGGKIGIGVGSPTEMMEITNTGGTGSQIQLRDTSTGTGSGDGVRFGYNGSGAQIWNFESTYIRFATSNVERLRIDSDGQATFDKGAPGSSNQVIARFQAESSRRLDIVWHDSGSLLGFDLPGSHSYIFKCAGSEKLRIGSTGHISYLNTSPPAWQVNNGYANMTFGSSAYLRTDTDPNSNFLSIGSNAYRGSSGWQHVNSGYATQLQMSANDGHLTYNTSTLNGSAGNSITWNEVIRVTLNEVGIGGAPSAGDGATYNNWSVPKLFVRGNSDANKFHLVGRFRAGNDSDNTGAQIVIHHENDRGMALQGGRSTSNRSYGAIKSLDNLARESNVMTFQGGSGAGVDNIKFYAHATSNTTSEVFRLNETYVRGLTSRASFGGEDRRRYQMISGRKTFSASNTYMELFFSGHTNSITIHYQILQNENWVYGGAHGKVNFFTVYGSTNGMQDHNFRRVAMNGGQISGDPEFQYQNSGGSVSHIIRVRVPYSSTSNGTFQIAYSVTGLASGSMYPL